MGDLAVLSKARIWAVVTPVSLVAGAAMMVAPTQAAPLPASYAAQATGDLWHVEKLDLDMSGDPASVDIGVSRVDGLVGSASTTRSHAEGDNVAGTSATGQSVRRGAVSNTTQGADTAGPVAGSAPAGVLASAVDLDAANLSARARWAGDLACLPATDRLTDSRASTTGANLVATAIPGEDPLATIPIVNVPIPDPSGGGLPLPDPSLPPIDLPGLPTSTALPTEIPTSGLPTIETTLPTTLPTSILPTLPTTLPTSSLPTLPLPREVAPAADGPVEMMAVSAAALEQHTLLEPVGGDPAVRAVRSEVIGTMVNTSTYAATFFGGESAVRIAGTPKLVALSDGTNPGKVVWAPAPVTVHVAGQASPINVPADGTPVTTNYSGNRQVVLEVSAGQLTPDPTPSDLTATGAASAVHVKITRGDTVVLETDLFPMAVQAQAPQGGVECRVGDSDGDKLTDDVELELGTDPHDPDTDNDRLKDGREVNRTRTNPLRADTDRDGLKDGREVKKTRTKPLRPDTDRDGLKDGREVKKIGTNPRKKDTDGDGVSDGREVRRGTNPLKPN